MRGTIRGHLESNDEQRLRNSEGFLAAVNQSTCHLESKEIFSTRRRKVHAGRPGGVLVIGFDGIAIVKEKVGRSSSKEEDGTIRRREEKVIGRSDIGRNGKGGGK